MGESKLSTVDLYEQALAAAASLPGADAHSVPAARSGVSRWERAVSRLSLVMGAGLVVVIAIMALGYFNSAKDSVSARAKKSNSPIDWLLWFGGAKQDQTFEKYIRDTTAKSQEEWDERYRNSPMSQFSREGVDWSKARSNFDLPPTFPTQSPEKR
jgi:hypothetical protein